MATPNIRLILSERRKAARQLQLNATPPIVPRANPPTSMYEVPPGIAPFRAVKPWEDTAGMIPKDDVGEIDVPVDEGVEEMQPA